MRCLAPYHAVLLSLPCLALPFGKIALDTCLLPSNTCHQHTKHLTALTLLYLAYPSHHLKSTRELYSTLLYFTCPFYPLPPNFKRQHAVLCREALASRVR